jgi:hypothetical protein
VKHKRSISRIKKYKTVCADCKFFKNKNYGITQTDVGRVRSRAKERGIAWGLTKKDVENLWNKQGGRCAYSGAELRKNPRTWSIDRIDNSCGYLPHNVQLTTIAINYMRGALAEEEFIAYCRQVANYRKTDDQ